MDYTFVEKALLEGNLSSLKHVKIKDLEEICDYFGVKVLVTDYFIKRNQDAHEQQEDVQQAKKELSEYQTILLNTQELIRDLRENKRKKSNCTKDYDWEDEERDEFWEDEEPESEFQEDSEDDFDYSDLATRLAEIEEECKKEEKKYLNIA